MAYADFVLNHTHKNILIPSSPSNPHSSATKYRRQPSLNAVADPTTEKHSRGRYRFCLLGKSEMLNEGMSRRAIHKAFWESAALIGPSVLQVYLL
ncbi:unnamed protein product [Camellia sinensis]